METLRLSPFCPHKPTPKQTAFLLYDGLEAFYGGAASGGKTDALLSAALQYADVPGYAAILFRRSYTDLALPGALMDKAHDWLSTARKTGEARWDRETHTYHFAVGSSLSFGYVSAPKDMYRYQSAEFQYIGWDEITEFPDDTAYLWMFSRLRKTKKVDVPLRVRAASNPVNVGAQWVKNRFIDNPEGRLFIPANIYDNQEHVDLPTYLESLSKLPLSTQKRLIEGSWDEVEDAAFQEFSEDIHVVPPMQAPRGWRRWEAMDFGVSNPTAWLTAGLSPEGHTVVFGEYYAPGLISHTASRILTLRNLSWGQPDIALCDPSIKNKTGFGSAGIGETVHSEFAKWGVYLVPAINDRIAGRIRISELLRCDPSLEFPSWHPTKAGELGSPRLFFTSNCTNAIEQIKLAPIDAVGGETVDPFWETRNGHACAAMRYLTTARIYPREVLRDMGVSEFQGSGRSLRGRTGTQWKEWEEWG